MSTILRKLATLVAATLMIVSLAACTSSNREDEIREAVSGVAEVEREREDGDPVVFTFLLRAGGTGLWAVEREDGCVFDLEYEVGGKWVAYIPKPDGSTIKKELETQEDWDWTMRELCRQHTSS